MALCYLWILYSDRQSENRREKVGTTREFELPNPLVIAIFLRGPLAAERGGSLQRSQRDHRMSGFVACVRRPGDLTKGLGGGNKPWLKFCSGIDSSLQINISELA